MFTFRLLSPADLFLLIEMEQVVFAEDPWSEAMLADELNLEDRLYVGAYAEGELIGYAGARVALDTDVMTVGVLQPVCVVIVGFLSEEHLQVAVRVNDNEHYEEEAGNCHELLNENVSAPGPALLWGISVF